MYAFLILPSIADADYLREDPIEYYGVISAINGIYPNFKSPSEALIAWKNYYNGLIKQTNMDSGVYRFRYEWLATTNSEADTDCKGIPSITNGTPHWYCQAGDYYQKTSINGEWQLTRKDRGVLIVKRQRCPKFFQQNFEHISGELGEPDLVVHNFCEKITNGPPLEIEISGPSVTNSLPSLSGPILQKISISLNGVLKPNEPFSVNLQDEYFRDLGAISGSTNNAGYFDFMFVPPFFTSSTIHMNATCRNCLNTANKIITVLPDYLSEQNDMHMCLR
ncbi:hypothetical protein GCM10027276_34530 [Comamonas piscis]